MLGACSGQVGMGSEPIQDGFGIVLEGIRQIQQIQQIWSDAATVAASAKTTAGF